MNNRLAVILGVAAFLIIGVYIAVHFRPKPIVEDLVQITSLDQLMQSLADRTSTNVAGPKGAPDFKVVVTQADYPIGTLVRPNSTIPVQTSACLPNVTIIKAVTPNLYPNYELTRDVAAEVGLGEVLPLLGADVKGSSNAKVKLSFVDPGLKTLSDDDLATLTTSEGCRKALVGRTVWLIRGVVVGKRNFSVANNAGSEVSAKVEKITNFKVEPKGASSLSLSDANEVSFLQVVSELTIPATKGREPASEGAPTIVEPAIALDSVGKVYVQRDVADTPENAEKVRTILAGEGLDVVKGIERIDTAKMPRKPQVRYFNAADEGKADAALKALRSLYPEALKVRIPLPAPAGQLEVWLPRVGPTN